MKGKTIKKISRHEDVLHIMTTDLDVYMLHQPKDEYCVTDVYMKYNNRFKELVGRKIHRFKIEEVSHEESVWGKDDTYVYKIHINNIIINMTVITTDSNKDDVELVKII